MGPLMWGWVLLACLLAVAAWLLWPRGRDQVWHMHCTECQWKANVTAPNEWASKLLTVARAIANAHMEQTGHQPVIVEEKRR